MYTPGCSVVVAHLFWEQKVVCSSHTIPKSFNARFLNMLYLHLYVTFFLALLEIYFTLTLFITLMVVYAANAVYAILFLIGTFLSIGFVFIILGAEYLGLVLMIVYVGAIAILFLFILMLLDLRNLMRQQISAQFMLVFAVLVFTLTEIFLYMFEFGAFRIFSEMLSLSFGTFNTALLNDGLLVLSAALYNVYVYYVLGCGFILLFVMLGVVLLLSESSFAFNEQPQRQNKYLVNYYNVVRLGTLPSSGL